LAEHLLCKQGVIGSNPITSTIYFQQLRELLAARKKPFVATWVNGWVNKRL
tara:strand:- start:127 stop:279 length:153 start_codon:yes stop_codon:yes gene_type:complete